MVKYEIYDPGKREYVIDALQIKEKIKQNNNVLRQDKEFFIDVYESSFKILAISDEGELLGFNVIRWDGYIFFLGVDPEHFNEGIGTDLIREAAEKVNVVHCHVRENNHKAVNFYQKNGFIINEYITNYYSNGDDAYYIQLDDLTEHKEW